MEGKGKEKYADLIAKLLNQAANTSYPEEAETFLMRAQELMAKYAIDEAMIAAARGTSGDMGEITHEEFVVVGIYRFALGQLTHYVLINNGIKDVLLGRSGEGGWRTIGDKTYKETYILMGVGYKSDLDRARILATSLMLQAMSAENAWWKVNGRLYPKKEAHAARRGFLLAFAEGVYDKLRTATAAGKRAAEAEHGTTGVALVLRDKSLAVQDEFEKMFPDTRKSRSRLNAGDAFARDHGFTAGRNADVGQPGLKGNRKELA